MPYYISSAALSPDGKTIATITNHDPPPWQTRIRLWDAESFRPLGEPIPSVDITDALAFHPTKRQILATGARDKVVRFWDLATRKVLVESIQHPEGIGKLAFRPDGRVLATCSSDGAVRILDATTGREIMAPLRHANTVHAVAFSPDGSTLLTGGSDGARLWNTANGGLVGPILEQDRGIGAVAFSPDGKTVLVGLGLPAGDHGAARLWDVATARPIGPPLEHLNPIRDMVFRHDGRVAMTASMDGTVRFWRVPTAIRGTDQRLGCWVRSVTGLSLGGGDQVTVLDAEAWSRNRRELEALGGPP